MRLTVKLRRAGGVSCAPRAGDDPGERVINEDVSVGAFDVAGTYTPAAAGDYLVCAWLDDFGTPVIAGPVAATVTVRAANLSILTAAPARVRPGASFKVTVNYNAEVSRYLSLIFAQGPTCGDSPSALHGASANAQDLISSTSVSGAGSVSKVATAPDSRGTYLLCSFFEESLFPGNDVAFLGQTRIVQVVAAARTTSCGTVGGPRHITAVRALRVRCRTARGLARRWGRTRPAPHKLSGLNCRAKAGRVTCSGNGKRVTFHYRAR